MVAEGINSWERVFEQAAAVLPAQEYREVLAATLYGCVSGSVFVAVGTCPPGLWRPQWGVFPTRHVPSLERAHALAVPLGDDVQLAATWRAAIETHGQVYAPVKVAPPGARAVFEREVLGPVGANDWLAGFLISSHSQPLGAVAICARTERALGDSIGAQLRRTVEIASSTLERALALAEGCGARTPQLVPASLTKREREVAQLIAEGYSRLNVAATLSVSEDTVVAHLRSVYRKLSVHSRVELVRVWNSLT